MVSPVLLEPQPRSYLSVGGTARRVITEAAKQSREGWGSTGDWTEVEVRFGRSRLYCGCILCLSRLYWLLVLIVTLGSMGVETQVLGAILCCPLCWRDFCRSRAPDHIPLLPRVSREQVCSKAVSNHPSFLLKKHPSLFTKYVTMNHRVLFD